MMPRKALVISYFLAAASSAVVRAQSGPQFLGSWSCEGPATSASLLAKRFGHSEFVIFVHEGSDTLVEYISGGTGVWKMTIQRAGESVFRGSSHTDWSTPTWTFNQDSADSDILRVEIDQRDSQHLSERIDSQVLTCRGDRGSI